jgi:hypothetical protein
MMDLSNQTVLVIDQGLYVISLAYLAFVARPYAASGFKGE